MGGNHLAGKTNEGANRSHLTTVDRKEDSVPSNDAHLDPPLSFVRCVSIVDHWLVSSGCFVNEERGAMAKDNMIAGTYEVSPAVGYAGDVAPTTAWKILSERKNAVLIDCRTRAEWNYVGLPDLETLAKKPALIEWQVFPSMQPNPEFVTALSGALADKEAPLLFICRSGARSAAAAKAMSAAGYSTCLNVADGFEGPLDAQAKRGTAGGWKAAGLPWRQT